MRTIHLDIPANILIIAAGTGIYHQLTIEELVAQNTSFYTEEGMLYTNTALDIFLVAGKVDGNDYIKLFE